MSIGSIVSRQASVPGAGDPIDWQKPHQTGDDPPPDPRDTLEFVGQCGKVVGLGSLPVIGAAVNAASILSGGLQVADVSKVPLAFGIAGTAANVASCVAFCTGNPLLGCAFAAASGLSLLGEQLSINNLFS